MKRVTDGDCLPSRGQEVGREEQALEVLGEAIDKWSSAPSVQDGRPSDKGHELFLDRGVLRLVSPAFGVFCPDEKREARARVRAGCP